MLTLDHKSNVLKTYFCPALGQQLNNLHFSDHKNIYYFDYYKEKFSFNF